MTENMNLDQLNVLFSEYSDRHLVAATKNTEAFANAVYDVTDVIGDRYFMKVLQQQTPEAIATEVRMQQRLLAAGIGTPEYQEIYPGNYVGSHGDARFVLSRFIPGESPKTVTTGLIGSVGATLAKLHDCWKGISVPSNGMQWMNRDRVVRDLQGYVGSKKAALTTLVDTGEALFDKDLPTAVIHGDFWLSNFFADHDRITTVFDFETAEETIRIIDLARSFTSLKFNSDFSSEQITNHLFRGYDSAAAEPLMADERAAFKAAIAYVAGACGTWHAIHGTRYAEPYIALGNQALAMPK